MEEAPDRPQITQRRTQKPQIFWGFKPLLSIRFVTFEFFFVFFVVKQISILSYR
jgi:hypothetical protein